MYMKNSAIGGLAFLVLLGCSVPSQATVKMPQIFGDHMVLQQRVNLPVWGTADPGEEVTVSVGSASGSARADQSGKLIVKLAPQQARTVPVTVTVAAAGKTLKFSDVLIGDVWVCSGQSNMEFGINMAHNAQEAKAKANLPLIRLFVVPHLTSLDPLSDFPPGNNSHWVVCSPDTIGRMGPWSGFSAVGFFFGREIQRMTGQPVGLIGSTWGGTAAEAWTSVPALRKELELKALADRADQIRAAYPQAFADYNARKTQYDADKAKWDKDYGNAFNAAMKQWSAAVAAAQYSHQKPPPKPMAPAVPPPKAPAPADGGQATPGNLFNAMIAPLIPYGIKGVAWYQGESNATGGTAGIYEMLFSHLIADWRERWNEGNFPFVYVQISILNIPGPATWSLVREAQLETLSKVPNTAMAVAIDLGNPANVHPTDKYDIGLRLARAAEHIAYGEDIVYSGPVYDKMTAEKDTVHLSFTQTGSGLVIGGAPYLMPGLKPAPTANLVGFSICGEDRKWANADARIDGNNVVVSSPVVAKPIAVRYQWGNFPRQGGNLYNKEGLPASPFRTDNWDELSPVQPKAAVVSTKS